MEIVNNIKEKNVELIEDTKLVHEIESNQIDSEMMNPNKFTFNKNKDIDEIPTHDSDRNILDNSKNETFKKPILLIGPRKGNATKIRTMSSNIPEINTSLHSKNFSSNAKSEHLITLHKECKSEINSDVQMETKVVLPYIEPPWTGIPKGIYELEILKSGTIIEVIDLSSKSYHVIGRLPTCDISMMHPTISRYHAILQYRATENEKNGKGMYIYDLGSTHGTFWNGNRLKSKVYVRIQGDHMLRFGCSQRKFILKAPLDDHEEESEYSLTELKEMRKIELEEQEKVERQQLLEDEEQKRLRREKEESEGINWGMRDDADEETDLTENPYAQTNNEELFLDDPKKTLRGWFEREGYDLQYQTEDKGIGKFLCWVDLPIDARVGKSIKAEALVSGKKKEAVIQCALEACRTLDRYGLLRQANHEARKRKSRNWEEEDYYDSDEDDFLDRTGTIEKKREQRMKVAGKLSTKVETYDSLLEKHSQVVAKISNLENAIDLQKLQQRETNNSNVDALDAYMSILDSSSLNKTEIKQIKMKLFTLRKEEAQLLKLINITKPVNLPSLTPHLSNATKESKDDHKNFKSAIAQKKKNKPSIEKCDKVSTVFEQNKNSNSLTKKDLTNLTQSKIEFIDENKVISGHINSRQNIIFEEQNEITKSVHSSKNDFEHTDSEKDKRKKKHIKRNQQRIDKASKELQKGYDEDEFGDDYSMWLPPENQCGDGKTSLNEKFGY